MGLALARYGAAPSEVSNFTRTNKRKSGVAESTVAMGAAVGATDVRVLLLPSLNNDCQWMDLGKWTAGRCRRCRRRCMRESGGRFMQRHGSS